MLSENREWLVAQLGESGYRNMYGALSTLACGSIAVGYVRFGRGQGPLLWKPTGLPFQAAAFATQSLGLIGFSQLVPPVQLPVAIGRAEVVAGATPSAPPQPHQHPAIGSEAAKTAGAVASPLGLKARCPIDFDHSRRVEGKGEVTGAKRVTRHPVLWSMALTGLGSALGTAFATEVVFGAMPLAMALIGGWHQDRRNRASGALAASFDAATSHLPFAALLSGAQSWADVAEEFAWNNAAIGLGVGVLLATRRRASFRALK